MLRRAIAAEAAAREERDISLRLRARLREQHAEAVALKHRNEELDEENAHPQVRLFHAGAGRFETQDAVPKEAQHEVIISFGIKMT